MLRRIKILRMAILLLLGMVCLPYAVLGADTDSDLPHPVPRPGAEITNGIGMKLVYIPAGKLLRGSPKEEAGRFEDEQQHEVEITKGFYLGKFEVMQAEYEKVMGKNPSAFKGSKFPVETISWKDAKEFCRLLSLQEGIGGKEGKDGTGYRLPTEAEWELACRAGTTSPYYSGETITLKQANFYNVERNGSVAVGSYPPNPWGLHDMHGNVWEWCEERYAADIHKNSSPQDPMGPLKNATHRWAMRGGSWGSDPCYLRSAARSSQESLINGNIGFRVLLVPSK